MIRLGKVAKVVDIIFIMSLQLPWSELTLIVQQNARDKKITPSKGLIIYMTGLLIFLIVEVQGHTFLRYI